MIPYKQIELSDKEKIDKCLEGNTFRACDFSFTNLISWNPKFKTKYHILEDTLFLRFIDSNEEYYYMMPIGPMDVKKAIEMMKEDAKENNIPFQMKAISHDMWEIINRVLPGEFEYIHDRDNDEYIYLSEKQIFQIDFNSVICRLSANCIILSILQILLLKVFQDNTIF